jgi:hypothetical protein
MICFFCIFINIVLGYGRSLTNKRLPERKKYIYLFFFYFIFPVSINGEQQWVSCRAIKKNKREKQNDLSGQSYNHNFRQIFINFMYVQKLEIFFKPMLWLFFLNEYIAALLVKIGKTVFDENISQISSLSPDWQSILFKLWKKSFWNLSAVKEWG